MGMCLDGKGKFSTEVRKESIVLTHAPYEPKKEEDVTVEDLKAVGRIEFMIEDLDALEFALKEARQYLASRRAQKYASNEDIRKMLKRDWKGRYIQLKRNVQNRGGGIFRAGEVFKVVENYNGIDITREDACRECRGLGFKSVDNISEGAVILLSQDYDPNKESY